ncbi:MAG TPA: hypothetical protein VKF36_14135 [Syntrophorhabdales bacterium]|nr:hypothetical protein [Syntrophorhabdales bacterium]
MGFPSIAPTMEKPTVTLKDRELRSLEDRKLRFLKERRLRRLKVVTSRLKAGPQA